MSAPNTTYLSDLVRRTQEAIAQATARFRAGELNPDQLVEDITTAHRKVDEAVAAVPVPSCPEFCELPAGHPYHLLSDDATPARWHRCTFAGRDGFDVLAEVEEQATADGVVLGAWGVSTIGDLSQVSPAAARRIADKLRSAAELAEHAGGAR